MTVTTAPLPTWGDLTAALWGRTPDDAALAAPWAQGDQAAVWFSRAAWALRAAADAAPSKDSAKPILWLPDYFCNQSTAPVRDGGARIVFYPIGPDLEPKWDACAALAEQEPPDLFVLVHYFGHPADGARAREFCDQTGAALVEDAAHVLRPTGGIGGVGDFVFYSPAKVLAVPHGGLLLVRGAARTEAVTAAMAKLTGRAPATWTWMAKRALQKTLPELLLTSLARRKRPDFDHDPPYMPLPPVPQLGPPARRILARAGKGLKAFARLRWENAGALESALGNLAGCRALYPNPGPNIAPYRFILRCGSLDRARDLYNRFSAHGCPVETWPDLPPEVTANPEFHNDAIELRRTLLLLPVHQTAGAEDLVRACGRIDAH